MNVWTQRLNRPSVVCRALLAVGALALTGCSTSSTGPTFGTISVAGLSGVWRLEIVQRAGQSPLATPAGTTYVLTLSGNSVSTRADCNTCGGTYTLVGDSLSIPPMQTCTQAVCPTQWFEVLYNAVLVGDNTVGISGTTMTLNSPRGMLRFVR